MRKSLGAMKIGLMAFAMSLSFVTSAIAGQFEDAMAAYERGDYVEASRWFRKAADLGDASAQFNLGVMYGNGTGVPKDYAEAVKWFRKAADQGVAHAQYNLGNSYAEGHGVPKDYAEAVKWFRKAAEQGFALAQTNLGGMYYSGRGVPKDFAEAVKWFRKAADQGLSHAQYALGSAYEEGEGTPKDTVEAIKWYKKAATQDHVYAMYNLGTILGSDGVWKNYEEALSLYRRIVSIEESKDQKDQSLFMAYSMGVIQYDIGLMYEDGRGTSKDYSEAARWYHKSAEKSRISLAPIKLAVMYENGQGVPRNQTEAISWYMKSAESENAEAQYKIGSFYQFGKGIEQSYVDAVLWYRKASDLGHDKAQYNLAVLYGRGLGVKRDRIESEILFRGSANGGNKDAKAVIDSMVARSPFAQENPADAIRIYRKAADLGHASAQYSLATMYYEGRGVPQDYVEAIRWFRKAAEQADSQAQYSLGIIYANGHGVPKDYIAAYMWSILAISGADSDDRSVITRPDGSSYLAVSKYISDENIDTRATKLRDTLSRQMTPAQIAEAQKMARKWKPTEPPLQDGRATPSPQPIQATKEVTSGAKAAVASKSLKEEPRTSSVIKSGFVISHEGDVLTTDSMIQQCRSITIQPLKGPPLVAKLVATDSVNNLALLKASLQGREIARFREDKPMRAGDAVAAAGYPLSPPQSREANVISGVISAMAGIHGDTRHYQITAPIQNGNGGGPLVDNSGNVVGVIFAKLNATRIDRQTEDLPPNIGFAIKAELARKFLGTHGIVYETAPTISNLSAMDVGERIKRSTVAIECKLDPSALAATNSKPPAPTRASQGEPPVISIRGNPPKTVSQVIDVAGAVSSKGRITALTVDGTDTPLMPDRTFSIRRGIPLGDSEIRVVATDEWGQTSETRLKVTRVAASTDTALAPLSSSHLHGKSRPNSIALIIGIEQYKSVPPAEFAENDARSFYDYAINALGVPASRVKLLTGADAQRVDVEAAILTWLKPQVVKGQTEVFVFFSGHGLASDDGKDLYLLPQDGNRALLDRSALRRKELIDMIVDSGAKSATLFLDTCYSGGTRGKESLIASARPILVTAKEQAVPPNVTILAAAGNDQLSSSLAQAKHGLFSYFLMKGLEGDAAGPDRTITAAKLEAYLAEKIPAEAAKLGRTQTPQLIGDGNRVVSSW